MGSGAPVGSCAGPDSDSEVVVVQWTCNGGVDWQSLQQIDVSDKYTQPMCVLVRSPVVLLSDFSSRWQMAA